MRKGAFAAIVLVAAGLPQAAPAQAHVETCQGKDATIVKSTGNVHGTAGDDVIIGGLDTRVVAGTGNDTVCVGGGDVDGGEGLDSVEVRDVDGDEPMPPNGLAHEDFVALRNFEQLDVELGSGIDGVALKWTEVPDALSGTIDGAESRDYIGVRLPERVTLDLRQGRLTLGPGLLLSITGFEDAKAIGSRVRLFGDDGENSLGVSGCDIATNAGAGRDHVYVLTKQGGANCSGARVHGERGDDKLNGASEDDLLVGGPGRDSANGGNGVDRCVAETEHHCER